MPQLDMRVSKIRCGESTDGCASYVVTFEAGVEAADREFSVRQLDDYKKIEVICGIHSWTATRSNIRWHLDKDVFESPLIQAVIYFDMACNCPYSEEQLKGREKKIDWNAYFLQSEKNAERAKRK